MFRVHYCTGYVPEEAGAGKDIPKKAFLVFPAGLFIETREGQGIAYGMGEGVQTFLIQRDPAAGRFICRAFRVRHVRRQGMIVWCQSS
jgi:hypothetical protein